MSASRDALSLSNVLKLHKPSRKSQLRLSHASNYCTTLCGNIISSHWVSICQKENKESVYFVLKSQSRSRWKKTAESTVSRGVKQMLWQCTLLNRTVPGRHAYIQRVTPSKDDSPFCSHHGLAGAWCHFGDLLCGVRCRVTVVYCVSCALSHVPTMYK